MDEIIMGFEYTLHSNNLTEQIEKFISEYDNENYKIKLKDIHTPINTGNTIVKNNIEYNIYHVLISFSKEPMSESEKEEYKKKKENEDNKKSLEKEEFNKYVDETISNLNIGDKVHFIQNNRVDAKIIQIKSNDDIEFLKNKKDEMEFIIKL